MPEKLGCPQGFFVLFTFPLAIGRLVPAPAEICESIIVDIYK